VQPAHTTRLALGDGSRAAALLALSADADFSAHVWGARTPSLHRARRILDELAQPATPGLVGFFVIIADGESVAGVCRVDPVGRVERVATVGYAVAPAYRGRGHASDALKLIVEHAYLSAPLCALRASCDPANVASRRVLEKAGFHLTKRARAVPTRMQRQCRVGRLRYELTRGQWWAGLALS
jgi:RimJ/RimL family protein N-acetyltransferase